MADPITLPDASAPLTIQGNRMHPDWLRVFKLFADAYNSTASASSGAIESLNTVAVSASFLFQFPEDGDFTLILKAPFAFAITETTTKTSAGTATVTVKINSTALGGTANSASSSEQSQTHSSANAVTAGDDIVVTFSATSADCEKLSLTIAGTRDLIA